MILGFKDFFGNYVWEGSKTHTIRAKRNGPVQPRVGMMAHTFVGVRRKGQARLGNWPITRIEPIIISESIAKPLLIIEIDGRKLDPKESDLFVWRDGFRTSLSRTYRFDKFASLYKFCAYWRAQAKGSRALPFEGDVIHWTFDAAPIAGSDSKKVGRAPLPSKYGIVCGECGTVHAYWKFTGRIPFCKKCDASLLPFHAEELKK